MKPAGIEMEREAAGCGLPCRQVHVIVAVFFVAATLLNGESLLREAELMKYGRMHDLCVALARPVAAVTRALHLGRPRAWVEQWVTPGDVDKPAP